MPDAQRPPFHFWRFFFSLRGRVSRVPIVLFVFGPLLLLEGLGFVHGRFPKDISPQTLGLVYATVGLVKILLMWPQFAVMSKRLHDLGLPALPALAYFLPFIGVAGLTIWHMTPRADPLATPSDMEIHVQEYAALTVIGLYIGLFVGVLLLSFIPGTKGANRYGPDPRQQASPADAF